MIINNLCEFLQRSIYPMVGATPYELFLKVPLVNKQLATSDFTFRTRKKAAGVKYGK
jgi:hypothetical protein